MKHLILALSLGIFVNTVLADHDEARVEYQNRKHVCRTTFLQSPSLRAELNGKDFWCQEENSTVGIETDLRAGWYRGSSSGRYCLADLTFSKPKVLAKLSLDCVQQSGGFFGKFSTDALDCDAWGSCKAGSWNLQVFWDRFELNNEQFVVSNPPAEVTYTPGQYNGIGVAVPSQQVISVEVHSSRAISLTRADVGRVDFVCDPYSALCRDTQGREWWNTILWINPANAADIRICFSKFYGGSAAVCYRR